MLIFRIFVRKLEIEKIYNLSYHHTSHFEEYVIVLFKDRNFVLIGFTLPTL